jgi:(p)ppGpp synthase/HD superfamily hydrolase
VPTFLRDLPLALRAFTLAREAHREQRRESNAAQFIVHPLEVASLLHNTGHGEDLVAAGILVRELRSRATRGEGVLDPRHEEEDTLPAPRTP